MLRILDERDREELQKSIDDNVSNLSSTINKNKIELTASIEQNVNELQTNINNVESDLKSSISVTKTTLQSNITATKTELQTNINNVESELSSSISSTKTELQENIDLAQTTLTNTITNTKAELQSNIDQVAQDLEDNVTTLENTIEQTKSTLQTNIDDNAVTQKEYTDSSIAKLINGSPEALDTLSELAAALDDDENFAATMVTELGKKVDKVEGYSLSANDYTDEEKVKLANIENKANNYTLPVATSSALGGIMSGTDITIDDSGNVSINDYSHNHIISNIDNLQTSLDGKVPVTRTVNGYALSSNVSLTYSDVGASTEEYVDNSVLALRTAITTELNNKVDKVDGKELSANNLTDALKSNYDTAYTHSQSAHAPSDAEKNVQSDFNETDESSATYILNKPGIASADTLGLIKVGSGLLVDSSTGVLSVQASSDNVDLSNYYTKEEVDNLIANLLLEIQQA